MSKLSSRIIILDPDFEHDGGHNYVTNQILVSYLRHPAQIACPVTLPLDVRVVGTELHRCLPGNSYVRGVPPQGSLHRIADTLSGLLQRQPGYLLQREKYIAALFEFFETHQICSNDAILVHTGSTFVFDVLLAVLERRPDRQWPSLHLRQLRPVEKRPLAEAVHARLRSARQFTDVFMYAETDAFADELLRLGHARDDICKLELSDLRQAMDPACALTDTFRLAVLGTVRREKGHRRLASIAGAYRKLTDNRSAPGLKFMIHVGIIKNNKLFDQMIRDLTESGADFEIVRHPEGIAGHWNCLASSHAVLVPYEPDRYTDRGSGICIDAIACARPLVVSAGCTLQEYIRHGNGVTAASDEDCAAGILEIAENYPQFAGHAATQSKLFHSAQQSHPLFERLAAIARNVGDTA